MILLALSSGIFCFYAAHLLEIDVAMSGRRRPQGGNLYYWALLGLDVVAACRAWETYVEALLRANIRKRIT